MRDPNVENPLQNQRSVVAIGNYDFRPSGTVVKSVEIAAACADAGLPVELWVIRNEGALRARVPETVRIIETGSRLRLKNRSLDLAANIPSLAAALRKRTPALFLSGGNHLHLPAHIALLSSGRRRAIRFVARASNSVRHGTSGRWASALETMLNRLKFNGADLVICVSHGLAEEISNALPHKDVKVIPNGVDIGRIERLSSAPFDHAFVIEREKHAPVLATMGRLTRQKGFDILIQAIARLPARSATLIVIGEGSASQTAALKQLAQQHGISNRVAFIGYRDNPFAALSKADLFVSSSRWEGASNALIEALACGLPIVATDCPTGNREVVEAGPYGTLAPMEDPDGLAAAIMTEWQAGRGRAEQRNGALNWSLDQCMARWVELLAKELGRHVE